MATLRRYGGCGDREIGQHRVSTAYPWQTLYQELIGHTRNLSEFEMVTAILDYETQEFDSSRMLRAIAA